VKTWRREGCSSLRGHVAARKTIFVSSTIRVIRSRRKMAVDGGSLRGAGDDVLYHSSRSLPGVVMGNIGVKGKSRSSALKKVVTSGGGRSLAWLGGAASLSRHAVCLAWRSRRRARSQRARGARRSGDGIPVVAVFAHSLLLDLDVGSLPSRGSLKRQRRKLALLVWWRQVAIETISAVSRRLLWRTEERREERYRRRSGTAQQQHGWRASASRKISSLSYAAAWRQRPHVAQLAARASGA